MPKVRALKKSATREIGEVYEVSDEEARIITAPDGLDGQKAELVVEQTRDMRAEDSPLVEQPTRRGRYSRRDLRAQDE